jgi:hypothetical protein
MRRRLLGALGAGAAVMAMGLGGVAQASHGADDPAGHHHKHHGKHHHHHDDGPNHT